MGTWILEISENVRFINLCIYSFSDRDEKKIEQCILDFFSPFLFFLCSLTNQKINSQTSLVIMGVLNDKKRTLIGLLL